MMKHFLSAVLSTANKTIAFLPVSAISVGAPDGGGNTGPKGASSVLEAYFILSSRILTEEIRIMEHDH